MSCPITALRSMGGSPGNTEKVVLSYVVSPLHRQWGLLVRQRQDKSSVSPVSGGYLFTLTMFQTVSSVGYVCVCFWAPNDMTPSILGYSHKDLIDESITSLLNQVIY